MDPGSSTFLSGFSDKEILKYQQSDLLFRLNQKLFRLKANRTKKYTKNGNSKNKRRVLRRIEVKKANIVDNMHWQVINDLCKKYEVICLEKFNSKKCVESEGLSKIGKQNLNDLKHYQFRQRLTFKANNQGIEVILVNPYNTSKYCSSCGNVKPSMKLEDRIYNCSKCGLSMCRDLNACKNMLMLGISSKNSFSKNKNSKRRPELCSGCAKSNLTNYLNVIIKKCIVCKKNSAKYTNVSNEVNTALIECDKYVKKNPALYCETCKPINCVNIRKNLCMLCKNTTASYNIDDKAARYCASCKSDNMLSVKNKHAKCHNCLKTRIETPNICFIVLDVI